MSEIAKWSQVKKYLLSLDQAALIKLMKDVYDRSKDNREFLTARCAAANTSDALELYRAKVIQHFAPNEGFPDFKLSVARRAIRDYRAATGDLVGTIDLMLTYVEYGTQAAHSYGDMWESFYDSLISVFGEVAKTLRTPQGAGLYPGLRARLLKIAKTADGIGWGYGDMIGEELDELRGFFGDSEDSE